MGGNGISLILVLNGVLLIKNFNCDVRVDRRSFPPEFSGDRDHSGWMPSQVFKMDVITTPTINLWMK